MDALYLLHTYYLSSDFLFGRKGLDDDQAECFQPFTTPQNRLIYIYIDSPCFRRTNSCSENFEGKAENTGYQHFLLFP